jgi:hypothetical protein
MLPQWPSDSKSSHAKPANSRGERETASVSAELFLLFYNRPATRGAQGSTHVSRYDNHPQR